MAKADTWMPLYIGDYLADTTHLTADQHGAYLLLLMAAWKAGGSLPNDDEQLQAITKLSDERWKKSKNILFAFFLISDCFLIHKRLLSELEKASALSEKRRAAGKAGGRPKTPKSEEKKQNESKTKANEKQNSEQNETPSPSPSHIDLSEDKSFKTYTPDADDESDCESEDKPSSKPTITKAELKKLNPEIPANLIDEWFVIRKDKGAKSLTNSGWDKFVSQARKAGITLTAAMQCCVDKHWRGFEADWYLNAHSAPRASPAGAPRPLHNFDKIDYSRGVNPDGSF